MEKLDEGHNVRKKRETDITQEVIRHSKEE
jgi:hypothetical protein